jgi:hypothetical protein
MAGDDGGDSIFVYLGGEQVVPNDVTHVRIDRSVKIIPELAFFRHRSLVSVETHVGIEIIGKQAFDGCFSLRGIKLPGVSEIGCMAFNNCRALTDVEFGDKLETIEESVADKFPLGLNGEDDPGPITTRDANIQLIYNSSLND